MSDSLITTLCDLVKARLEAQTELSSVTVVNQSDLRILDKTEQALAGQGLVVVVMVDSVTPTPPANDTVFSVGIIITENLAQNRSGSGRQLPASEAAEYCAASLTDWTPADIWSAMEVNGITQLPAGPDELQWTVDAQTRVHVRVA